VTIADGQRAADLLDEGEPEVEFFAGVAGRMPRKRVAAGAVLHDGAGRLLLVEPRYNPTWDIPGGIAVADESPLDACRRELAEELGLHLPVHRLLVVDWVPQQGVWHDAVLFVFDGGVIAPGLLDTVTLPDDELAAVRLVGLDDAAGHLRPSSLRRLRVALDLATRGGPPAYLQFGRHARG